MTGSSLFAEKFFQERAKYGDVASDQIRSAGRPTKAWPNGEDERWWLTHGPEMVDKYVAWRDETGWAIWKTPDGRPAIELEILADVGIGLPIKMFIDRIFVAGREPLIVDLKSGARSPASDLQLGIYRVGVLQQLGVRIDFGAYFDARKGVLSAPVNLTRYTPTLVGHWFRQYHDAVQAGIFLPNLSHFCRGCGVRDFCAAYGGTKAHRDPDSEHGGK